MTYQAPHIQSTLNGLSLAPLELPSAQKFALKLLRVVEAALESPSTASLLTNIIATYGGETALREKLLSLSCESTPSSFEELFRLYSEIAPHVMRNLWKRNLCTPRDPVEEAQEVSLKVSCTAKQAYMCIDTGDSWQFENLLTGERHCLSRAQYRGVSDTIYFAERIGEAYIIVTSVSSSGIQNQLFNLTTGEFSVTLGRGKTQNLTPTFSREDRRAYYLTRGNGPWEIREAFSDRLIYSHPRLNLGLQITFRPQSEIAFGVAEILSQPALINLKTGILVKMPEEKVLRIKRPAFSADGSVGLTVVECENGAYVLNLLTGEAQEFRDARWVIEDPVLSPNGKDAFVRIALEGGSAILDLFSLSIVAHFNRHISAVETPEFAPDGSRVFVRVLNIATVSIFDLHSRTELRDTTHNTPINILSPIIFNPARPEAYTLATGLGRSGVFNVYAETFIPFPEEVGKVFEWEPVISGDGQHIFAKLVPASGPELLFNLRTNTRIDLPHGYNVSADGEIQAIGKTSIVVAVEDSIGNDAFYDLTGDTIASFNRLRVQSERSA